MTFIPTTTSGSILCFSVLAIEDNTLEGDETVSLMLSADDDVATISNSEVQLTIQDVLQEGGRTFCFILRIYGRLASFLNDNVRHFCDSFADITAAFNFTTLEGAEGTTVMVCAEITSLLILNTSVTFQIGISEPSDVGKSITLHVIYSGRPYLAMKVHRVTYQQYILLVQLFHYLCHVEYENACKFTNLT